jgi:hypothetical protein
LSTPPRAHWTIGQFVALAKDLPSAERERVSGAPVLLISPIASSDQDEEVHTLITMKKPDVGGSSPDMDRLVVPLVPGALNATPDRLTVGRSSVCDVVLGFAEVSKVHAYVYRVRGDTCDIEDAGSTNGTTLEGKPLEPNVRTPIRDGARVSLGGLIAEFRSPKSFQDEFLSPKPR